MHPSSNTPPLPSNRSFGMLLVAVFVAAGAVSAEQSAAPEALRPVRADPGGDARRSRSARATRRRHAPARTGIDSDQRVCHSESAPIAHRTTIPRSKRTMPCPANTPSRSSGPRRARALNPAVQRNGSHPPRSRVTDAIPFVGHVSPFMFERQYGGSQCPRR